MHLFISFSIALLKSYQLTDSDNLAEWTAIIWEKSAKIRIIDIVAQIER